MSYMLSEVIVRVVI